MSMTADSLYGHIAQSQPNAVPAPTHAPGTPEPWARTEDHPERAHGVAGNPVFVLVAMLGLAVLIMHLSFKGEVRVG